MSEEPSAVDADRPSWPQPLIGVVGPTGAGKSLAAAQLARATGFHLFLERIDDNQFFAPFTDNPKRWAFHFQLAFMLGAVADAAEARSLHRGAVIERPVEEMYGIFVRDHLLSGTIGGDEAALLRMVVGLGDRLAGTPDLLVALRAPPEVLLERIRHRGRAGEENLKLDYLRRLDDRYGEWLAEWPGPLILVDTVGRDLRVEAEVNRLVAQIRRKLSGPSD